MYEIYAEHIHHILTINYFFFSRCAGPACFCHPLCLGGDSDNYKLHRDDDDDVRERIVYVLLNFPHVFCLELLRKRMWITKSCSFMSFSHFSFDVAIFQQFFYISYTLASGMLLNVVQNSETQQNKNTTEKMSS